MGVVGNAVEIVSYREEYRPFFEQLNREWIEHYFALEDADRTCFRDPYGSIVAKGGEIFFVVEGGQVAGTCAAVRRSPTVFELAKMAVAPRAQGRGLGDLLVGAVIGFCRAAGAEEVVIQSNTRLVPAIRLYRKHGFVPVPLGARNSYERVDIEMRLDLR